MFIIVFSCLVFFIFMIVKRYWSVYVNGAREVNDDDDDDKDDNNDEITREFKVNRKREL